MIIDRNEPMPMRYFFFSYVVNNHTSRANGNIWIESERFPSNAGLKEIANVRHPGMDVVITGWQEFASKDDYDAFRGA